jgi:hemolysin activation/secretion protein
MNPARSLGWVLSVAIVVLPLGLAKAQQPRPPDAGRVLKDAPQPPPFPSPPPPTIQLPAPAAPPTPEARAPAVTFELKDVVFKGNTVFGPDLLRALAADKIGQRVTLADLEEIARRVTERYQQAGYPLAQAVVPAQDVSNGVVEISVLEGRLGKIRFNKDPEAPVSDARLSGIASSSMPVGQPITQRDLERTMLLLSDIPGIRVESALELGEEVGTTDLVIDVHEGPPVLIGADVDNWGSYYTGQYRAGLYARVNSPFGLGDNLDLRLFDSSGGGQVYGRAAYEVPVGYQGTRLGIAAARVTYELQKEFATLGANGSAGLWELSATHPFIRSRASNLFGRLSYENIRLVDKLDVIDSSAVREVSNLGIGLAYELRDTLLGGGYTGAGASIYFGDLEIKSAEVLAIDQSPVGRHTEGSFTRVAFQGSRLQQLIERTSFFLGIAGQWANKNLDSSQQIALGGPRAVRAYPVNEAVADKGVVVNAELRYAVTPGVTVSGFYDFGWARFNVDPPPTVTDNDRTLRGFGAGLYWTAPWGMTVTASVAWPDSGPSQSAPNRDPRFFFQISQGLVPWMGRWQ